MNKWIEHNKKKYGVEIRALESIISADVRRSIPPNQFTSDMLVALKSGRKITTRMEHYISKIVTDNKSLDPKDKSDRLKWLESVMPKIIMVINLVDETNWSGNYKQNKLNFLESIKRQANHKLSLSKKQMEFVTKIYNQCKKNIEKNENKS
jgi:hypothetical protein